MQARANWRDEPVDKIFNITYDEKVTIKAQNLDGSMADIGEAQLEVWPGKTATYGKIIGVNAIFVENVIDKRYDEQA